MILSQVLYTVFIALTAGERIGELFTSRRHAAWAFARGGVESGRGHFPAMVLLHAGSWSAAAAALLSVQVAGSMTLLDYTCMLVVLGCVWTMAIRLNRILDALDAKSVDPILPTAIKNLFESVDTALTATPRAGASPRRPLADAAVTAIGGNFAVEDNRDIPDTLEVIWRYQNAQGGGALVSFTQINASAPLASAANIRSGSAVRYRLTPQARITSSSLFLVSTPMVTNVATSTPMGMT